MLSIECQVNPNNILLSSFVHLLFHFTLYACSFQNIILMATFFGEVVTGSYRYIDPNQPDYNEARCIPQTWRLEKDIDKEKNLLLITVGDIAGEVSYNNVRNGLTLSIDRDLHETGSEL